MIYRNIANGAKFPKNNLYRNNAPTVSIILCNKDESMKVFAKSIQSIIQCKKYAETKLNINHIRLILADGGSRNIKDIQNSYETAFDSIEIIVGGKLSGRHFCSINETSDIIVAYDSDRKYEEQNTYELILPFINDWRKYVANGKIDEAMVVGTTGGYINSDAVFPFNGGNSAYLRDVYLQYPFNTKINQTTLSSVWKEEEIDWANNLVKCGRVDSVKAFYCDINPLPLYAIAKRIFNCENSFSGGMDRWHTKESTLVIIYKTFLILALAMFFPWVFNLAISLANCN